jgi:hypothetical protein
MAFCVRVEFSMTVVSPLVSSVGIAGVMMHLFYSVSRVSAESWRCHFGEEGIHPFYFDEALPGVFLSQASTVDAPEFQHPASSLHRVWS